MKQRVLGPRIIMGQEGPICPIDKSILIKAELFRWRKEKNARRMEQDKLSRLFHLPKSSVNKRLHSPGHMELLTHAKSRNKSHHKTTVSLPPKLDDK